MTGYRHTSFLGAFDISRRANLFDTWPIHAETRVCRTPSGWWAVTSLADVRRMCRDQLDARIDSGAATWMERHYRLIADFANYFVPIAEERSRRPGHDLISDVAPGEGEILNTCDAVIFFFTSLGAGIETMSNLMGNAATALMRHPDQMRMVKKGSDLVADALEESLRSTEPADLGAYEHPAASASPSALTTVLPCRDDRARSPPEGIHGELERVAELPALQSTSPKSTRKAARMSCLAEPILDPLDRTRQSIARTDMTSRIKVAIIGSGNIGTDLMFKVMRLSRHLEMAAMVGIDAASDGLARARRLHVPATAEGVDGLTALPGFDEIGIIFDATSAKAHIANAGKLAPYGKRLIDLTPAAIGPFVVPAVNLSAHLDAPNINMVTCGGQATIPVVAAVNQVAHVSYAEIVASIASKSAGPGTRANIDEFTETTSHAIETVGGAQRGKAIIILNPAEPPLIMRDTVYCLIADADHDAVRESVAAMIEAVAQYVPGYRLKQQVQFTPIDEDEPVHTLLPAGAPRPTTKVSVFLEVEGAAHYLPAYAGNLDIMTSAALQVADRIAAHSGNRVEATA